MTSTPTPTPTTTGPILVTAAIIRDPARARFLIARRKDDSSIEAGKWEFPGGKVEPGEDLKACLAREILEETGCKISVDKLFDVASHVYEVSGKRTHVVLLCYECTYLDGEAKALDAGEVRWVSFDVLRNFDWAEADKPLVTKLVGAQPTGS